MFVRAQPVEFLVYVEGRPGPSGLPVGEQLLNTKPTDPARRPDLQIQSEHGLGNGSRAVCDKGSPGGGVPGISPPDFTETQAVSDALNDASCRFKVYDESDFACTQDSLGDFVFAHPSSTAQFCMLVNEDLAFPQGNTVLSARLRDTEGNAGPVAQIVVRIVGSGAVSTPTPGGPGR